jgi:hypothetical protein
VDQLYVGLKAGIEGGIHVMRLLFETHKAEDEWGFLLIDTKNEFNEGNKTTMYWTVHHQWPFSAWFTFNCYWHWLALVVWSAGGTSLFLSSKEGAYGILLLPLILKDEVPDINQSWYADDAGAGGSFNSIQRYFEKLQEEWPRQGYFLEPSKSILIVQPHNKVAAKIVFKDLSFTDITGTHYLGGFLGAPVDQLAWIQEKTASWVEAIKELALVAERYP